MEEEKVQNSLTSQSVWLLFAKIIGFVFMTLLPLLVVRFLTPSEVGVYRQTFLIIANANAILPLGVGLSAFYYLSRETERRGAAIFNILLFNFVVGGLAFTVLAFFPEVLGHVFRNAEIVRLAPLIGLVIWFWIFSSFLETVAVANQEARLATVFIISAQLTKTLLMVSAVVFFTTVDAFVYAALVQAVLQTIVLLIYLCSRFPGFWTQFDLSFLTEQLRYALPFGLAGLLWTLQTDIHNYFVGYRFSEAEYAIYTTGCFELPLIGMISEAVASVLIPQMSKLEAAGDKREMWRLVTRAMQRLSFFYFPAYFFFLITAELFIVTLFTSQYSASVPIFLINITLMPFYVLLMDPVVRAYSELGRLVLTIRIFIFTAMISALVFAISHFDMRGMIAIVVVVAALERIIATVIVVRKLNVSRAQLADLTVVGKTVAAAVCAALVLFVFYYFAVPAVQESAVSTASLVPFLTRPVIAELIGGLFTLGVCFAVFSGVYLFSGNLFGIIEDADRRAVRERLSAILRLFGRRLSAGN